MMSGPYTMTVSTQACDDLFRLMVAPMTPRSDRRALMSTSLPGVTRSSPLHATVPISGAPGHRRKTRGDRVYERG